MKLLVLIPNFGFHQATYLERVLEEYTKFKSIEVKVVVFTTEFLSFKPNLDIEVIKYDASIGAGLSLQPRLYAFDNLDKYDLYMHQENDTLITEDNILCFIEGQSRINLEYNELTHVHGFLRYENEQHKYLIDNHKNYPVCGVVDNIVYFSNVHQGGWLLTNNQLKLMKDRNIPSHYGSLEDYCSNFYYSATWPGTTLGLNKIIYQNLVSRSGIYHLPNKYSAADPNHLTLNELI
jgi:hypothetical protein